MRAALAAGLAYGALAFAAGVVLGTIRTVLLAPATGPVVAVLVELPVMLALLWVAARRVVRRFSVPADLPPRLAMGALAFAVLIVAELLFARLVFGRTAGAFLSDLLAPTGRLGLAGQLVFASFPALQMRGR